MRRDIRLGTKTMYFFKGQEVFADYDVDVTSGSLVIRMHNYSGVPECRYTLSPSCCRGFPRQGELCSSRKMGSIGSSLKGRSWATVHPARVTTSTIRSSGACVECE